MLTEELFNPMKAQANHMMFARKFAPDSDDEVRRKTVVANQMDGYKKWLDEIYTEENIGYEHEMSNYGETY